MERRGAELVKGQLMTKEPIVYSGEKAISSINDVKKTGQPLIRQTGLLSYIIHKN